MQRKKWVRCFALIMGCSLFLAVLAACGSGANNSQPSNNTVIKVATEFPTTNKDATQGKPAENGAYLAFKQAEDAHTISGVTLQFVPKDDVGSSGAHDPQVGATNVRALVSDYQVAGIVGPFNSGVAKDELPITNPAPIAQISPSTTNSCLTQDTPAVGCSSGSSNILKDVRPTGKVTFFRTAATDDHQGPAGADYLYNTRHYKTAYVIDDTEVYGAGLAQHFLPEWQKLGGTVVGKQSIANSTNAATYDGVLTQIAHLKPIPDVIYFAGTEATGGTLLRQQMLKNSALSNIAFAGGDGVVDKAFAEIAGKSAADLKNSPAIGSIPAVDVSGSSPFAMDYKAKYGELGTYSAGAYDDMNILIQSIKIALGHTHAPKKASEAPAFRQAVINAMQGISYDGVTGHTSFDANGDTTNKVFSIQEVDFATKSWKTLQKQTIQ